VFHRLEKVAIISGMPNNKKTYIVAVLAFLWCFGIIAVYYVSHKPFTPELAASVLLAGWRIVVGFAMVALAGGIGYFIYKDDALHPLAQLALQMALGSGILALVFLLVGVTIGLPALAASAFVDRAAGVIQKSSAGLDPSVAWME
jgi:uncharacterized membrane protein (GlpM family)